MGVWSGVEHGGLQVKVRSLKNRGQEGGTGIADTNSVPGCRGHWGGGDFLDPAPWGLGLESSFPSSTESKRGSMVSRERSPCASEITGRGSSPRGAYKSSIAPCPTMHFTKMPPGQGAVTGLWSSLPTLGALLAFSYLASLMSPLPAPVGQLPLLILLASLSVVLTWPQRPLLLGGLKLSAGS